eukprot:6958583-Prorocentrum_lima.AAC.1
MHVLRYVQSGFKGSPKYIRAASATTMEYARVVRDVHRFAYRGRKRRTQAQGASTTNAKQGHSLK